MVFSKASGLSWACSVEDTRMLTMVSHRVSAATFCASAIPLWETSAEAEALRMEWANSSSHSQLWEGSHRVLWIFLLLYTELLSSPSSLLERLSKLFVYQQLIPNRLSVHSSLSFKSITNQRECLSWMYQQGPRFYDRMLYRKWDLILMETSNPL